MSRNSNTDNRRSGGTYLLSGWAKGPVVLCLYKVRIDCKLECYEGHTFQDLMIVIIQKWNED